MFRLIRAHDLVVIVEGARSVSVGFSVDNFADVDAKGLLEALFA